MYNGSLASPCNCPSPVIPKETFPTREDLWGEFGSNSRLVKKMIAQIARFFFHNRWVVTEYTHLSPRPGHRNDGQEFSEILRPYSVTAHQDLQPLPVQTDIGFSPVFRVCGVDKVSLRFHGPVFKHGLDATFADSNRLLRVYWGRISPESRNVIRYDVTILCPGTHIRVTFLINSRLLRTSWQS